MKKMKKLLCFALVFGLVFTSGIFAFADDIAFDEVFEEEILLDEIAEEIVPLAEEIIEDEFFGEVREDIIPASAASFDGKIGINWVQVLTEGSLQILYRDSVYQGDPMKETGESASLFYTTEREFDLKDQRRFRMEFFVPAGATDLSAGEILNGIRLTYGVDVRTGLDVPISAWGNGNNLRGATQIMTVADRAVAEVDGGGYRVSFSLTVNSPWGSGYIGGSQNSFGTGQTADNRAWWQCSPTYAGIGTTYPLKAFIGDVQIASTDIKVGAYRDQYSWVEMNIFSKDIAEAITGKRITKEELDERPVGMMAAGYVAMDANGKFVKGDPAKDLYVEVHILGYGHTDNYATAANRAFNNYSRFNAQWNFVVARDKGVVDTYLNETLPTLNSNPKALKDKYINAAPEDIDMFTVYYQNNTHADEVTGTETMIHLIKNMIEGGKAGKKLGYKMIPEDGINWRYRFNAPGFTNNTSSHNLAGTQAAATRVQNFFDTKEALDNFIFVSTLCSNPDGKAGMRRVNRYAADMNRDVVYSTQPETIGLTKDLVKWNPMYFNEWHGYTGNTYIEPCGAPHNPTFEVDLIRNNILATAYAGTRAVIGSTRYTQVHIPWDQANFGAWDDAGTI